MKTIKDIAELANVSRTTVSRVLNNSGYVSEKSRKAVLKVIEETGYVPSEHAKALRTKQTKVIGVILPKISTETSSRVVNGLNEVLVKKGYQILLANTNLDKKREIENIALLHSRQVDGIILLATNTAEELRAEAEAARVPLIVVGQEFPGIPSIIFDDYGAAFALTEKFIEKGYHKIGFIGVDEGDRAVGAMRKKGYQAALEKHGLPLVESWVRQGDFSIGSGYEAAKLMLENGGQRPDAIFSATTRMALGVWQFAREKGWDLPDQLGLAGIGTSETANFLRPALATIEYEYEHAGMEAGKLLLTVLEGRNEIPEKIMLNYRLIERDSL